ncbi:TonB family protein [Myxococcota bacterium]
MQATGSMVALNCGLLVFSFSSIGSAETHPKLTRAPSLLQAVEPNYPRSVQDLGIEGPVELCIDIDAAGRVTAVEIVSAPDSTLANAAREAALNMVFSPAEMDGTAAAIRISYTFHFSLDKPVPEPARLKGVVRLPNGSPVPNAHLQLERADHPVSESRPVTTTNEQGEFSFELAEAGMYSITATSPHGTSQSVEAAIQPGETKEVMLVVSEPRPASEYEIVVRAMAPPPVITHRHLEREQLASVPGVFGDPIRVLETLPGMGRSPFSNGIMVMRGSSPDESAVYIDGHPVPLLYHFGGGPSVLPPDAIESIDLAPGGFGVRFGRSTGGVVEVRSRPGRADAVRGGADIDLFDAGGTLEGPIGDIGAFRFSGRRSYIDALIPLIPGQKGGRAILTLAPRYYDYHSRVDFWPASGLSVSVTAAGSDDELTFANRSRSSDLPSELDLVAKGHRINPRLEADLGQGFSLLVSPAVALLSAGGETPFEVSQVDSTEMSLRAELVGRRNDHQATIGVDVVRDDHTFTARVPLPRPRDFPSAEPRQAELADVKGELEVTQGGVFGEVQVAAGPVRISPGLRLEHVSFLGRAESALDPRLDVRARLSEGLLVKAVAGIYHKLPTPQEIARETGNPDLTLEQSLQGAVGGEWTFLDSFTLDVEGFVKSMTNLARRTSAATITNGEVRQLRYASDGQGRVFGAEIMLMRHVDRGINGWIAYSVSRSERRRQQGDWHIYARDQTHNLNLVISVDLPWGLRMGGRYRYVTGYPATPVVGADYDTDTARYIPLRGEKLTDRLPAFQQLDLRIEKLFGERTDNHIIVYVEVQNATNRRNAEFFEYSYDYSKRYEFPGLPILPSVGVEARF